MEQTVVKASSNRKLGSATSRRLRREGQLPGVLYGLGKDPVNVQVTYTELRDALKTDAGLNTVFHLSVDGVDDLVLVKEVQRHPVRREVIHVDFLRIDATQTLSVDIPIHMVGEAEEALNAGLLVDQILFSLTVECSPTAIPDSLEADISILTGDRNVMVGDIKLPAGVVTSVDPEDPVVSTVVPRALVEEVVEGEEVEGEEAVAEGEGEESAEGDDAGDGGGDQE
ncbi:MAG: 50S ribosomal protein L25 [Acidimicrobiales bacterium]|nr:50S ribosomal protein L25 [Acidimicrobiales bacterium]